MDGTRPEPTTSRLEHWSFERRIARLVRALQENVVYFDRKSRILEVSHGALDAFGYRRNEVVDHTVSEFLPQNTVAEHHAENSDFWNQGDHAIEARIRQRNGAFVGVRANIVIDLSRDGSPAGAITLLEVNSKGSRLTSGFGGSGTDRPYGLTPRELTVLEAAAAGHTDRQIAQVLGISPETVHKHISHILLKMGSPSRTDACVRATQEGWLANTKPS